MRPPSRPRWSSVATVLVLVATCVAAGPALAQPNSRTAMVCTFDVSGPLNPGLQLTPQGPGAPLVADGSISCSGEWDGRELLPDRSGKIAIRGVEGSGPAGSVHGGSSCVFGNDNLSVQVTLPQPRGGNVDASGAFDIVWEANWGQVTGTLDGVPYVGYFGIGADPNKPEGSCTDPHGYDNWEGAGRLVVGGSSQQGSAPQQLVIAGFQYGTAGSVNEIPDSSTHAYDYPVIQGDTVTWTNADLLPHTVTACNAARDPNCAASSYPDRPTASGQFDSDLLQTGNSFTLNTARLGPGTYHYFCEFHQWMRGSFTVLTPPGVS